MKPGRAKRSSSSKWWKGIRSLARLNMNERPAFSRSWLLEKPEGIILDERKNDFTRSTIVRSDEGGTRTYVIDPFEYRMDTKKIGSVLKVLETLKRSPPPHEILDDEVALRGYIERKAYSLISPMNIDMKKVDLLARITAQYSCGLGILEHLLRDERVQDIYIDAPSSERRVYTSLGGSIPLDVQGSMRTNIILSAQEMERLTSILRYHSGRPFSETNPVLECDIRYHNTRATAVSPPLSKDGISLALRKHSHDPWTLIRLIGSGALTPQCAAFLSLAVDANSTLLIAGPRGAGKSSLLGALLFEIETTQRMIIIEDTPELPIRSLNILGYKVLGLNVGPSSTGADKALRTALRLGESVLVMGEVRGSETKTLYEAMSAGTAGSSVMGTFHADSAKTVYKRAVEDMGVSPGSFSSTDLVVVTGLVQPKGSSTRLRRVVQVSELVKDAQPGTFRDLFRYDPSTDRIRPTTNFEGSTLLDRTARSWGVDKASILREHSIRSTVLSRSLDVFDRKEIARTGTVVRINTSFRQVKEKAVKEGWMGDVKRFIDTWRFAVGEVWD